MNQIPASRLARFVLLAVLVSLAAATQLPAQQPAANRSTSAAGRSDWIPPHLSPQIRHSDGTTIQADSQVVRAEFSKPSMSHSQVADVPADLAKLLNQPSMAQTDQPSEHLAHAGLSNAGNWDSPEVAEEVRAKSWTEQIGGLFGSTDITKMLGSLALVLGGYFGFVWALRKFNPRSTAGLPQEAVDVIGIAPFGPRRTLQLVRLGTKLMLLVNGPEGTHSIGEITEPREVEQVAALCSGRRTARRTDSVAALRRLVNQIQPPSVQAAPSAPPSSKPSLEQIVRSLQDVIRHTSGGNVFEA